MKPFNILIFFCFILKITGITFSQSNYSDYPLSEKTNVFFDDFDDNSNGWKKINKTKYWAGRIANGYLTLENKMKEMGASGSVETDQTIKIDENKDFEIEMKMKIFRGSGYSNYIYFSCKKKDKTLFGITDNGYYKVSKIVANKWYDYKDYTQSNLVKQGDFNILTVRKVKDMYYFFLNHTLVYTLPFEPLRGYKFGLNSNDNSLIQVDYYKLCYLGKVSKNTPPLIVIKEPDVSRGFKIIEGESVKITGMAQDPDGISSVTANGIEANVFNTFSFSVDVPLEPGDNKITIIATDKKMASYTKSFTIKRKVENKISEEKVVNLDKVVNGKRVALIFGNANYSGAANLGANPINDANDISATLKALGFTVITKTDANLTSMNNAIREFGKQNRDADVALFFFAGHGMQVDRVNYLVPIGINIKDKNDVGFECVSVSTVQRIMETSNADRLNLIILDACRNNPYRTWQRGGQTGLADMTPPSGTLIAFATSPGATAANGSGRNGLYTGELIKQLQKAQRIEDVFINTRVQVEKKSGGNQSPWELARLRGIYYLKK